MTVEGFRRAKKDLISKTLLTSPLPDGTIKEKEAYVRDKVIPNLKTDTLVPRQDIHRQGTMMYLNRQKELAKKNQYGPGYLTISDEEALALVREVIPEILAKNTYVPDDFTEEFIRLSKVRCGL